MINVPPSESLEYMNHYIERSSFIILKNDFILSVIIPGFLSVLEQPISNEVQALGVTSLLIVVSIGVANIPKMSVLGTLRIIKLYIHTLSPVHVFDNFITKVYILCNSE